MLVVVVLSLIEQRLDTRLREGPSTSVQRLLLSPDNGLGIGVAVEVLLELLPWEGVELLDSCDGHIIDLVVGTVLVQSGVNLTRANDDSINFLTCLDITTLMRWILDNPLELRVADKVLNVGASKRVTQKRLGKEDNQSCILLVSCASLHDHLGRLTFPELPVHLATEDVEQVGWGSHVRNLHIAVLVLTVQVFLRREDARVLVT